MGNETKDAKYWKKEEEKLCRTCRKEPEDIEHVLEKYERTGENKKKWVCQLINLKGE